MSKLKDPVIFKILETSFEVDIDQQVLRQTNDQANQISFINDMQDHSTYYRLIYDLDERRATEDLFDQNRVNVIDVPPLVALDPQGMSEKYGVSLEKLQTMTDFEVIVDQESLAKRREGILPQIDINGEAFIIDLKMHELRHAKYFFPVLSLRSFDLTEDGGHYTAFYDTTLKQPLSLDPKLTEFPVSVIQVKFPNEIGLDPVCAAKQYGMDERELLRRYPIQKNLRAELIPLSETDVPRLIRQNKDELRRQHEQNRQSIKPRQRPRI